MSIKFSLDHADAKLVNVNPRAELHGEDTQLAVDLKFEFRADNGVLSEFDGNLKSALYKKREDGQQELLSEAGDLRQLKFPSLAPVKWNEDMEDVMLTIHGVFETNDLVLINCKVDGFRFEPQDGGTVVIGFRVITHPNDKETGRICKLIGQQAEISLKRRKDDSLGQLEGLAY